MTLDTTNQSTESLQDRPYWLFPTWRGRGSSLDADRRGVSELLGLILTFALVISLVVLLQVSAVPVWNESVEYEHSQRLQQDFEAVGATTTRVAATGVGETIPVETGVAYPSRFLFVNPPPASGTLRLTDPDAVSFENVAFADPNAESYWSTAPPDLSTRALVYEPGYNEYRDAGVAVYEGSVQYRAFDAGVLVDRVSLVDGNRITLVLVDGDLHRNAVDPTNVDLVPLSAPSQQVTVGDDGSGDNVLVTVPSDLPAAEWRAWLEADGEMVDQAGRVVDVTDAGPGLVTVELAQGDYRLRIARLGVGGAIPDRTAAYLVPVGATDAAVSVGERVELTVEARDQYNNPVEGVAVEFAPTLPTAVTDDAGRASVSFVPDSDGTYTFTASVDDDGDGVETPYETVEYRVVAGNSQLAALLTGSGLDLGSMINPTGEDVFVYQSATYAVDKDADEVRIDVTFDNAGTADLELTRVRANFVSANAQGASTGARPVNVTLTYPPKSDTYEFALGDPYYELTPAIDPPAGAVDLRVTLSDFDKNKAAWDDGNFLVLSLEFRDEDTGVTTYGTYFVVPSSSK
jgi:flagellin-like protein